MTDHELAAVHARKPDDCPCGQGEAHPHRLGQAKVVGEGEFSRRVIWYAAGHREGWEQRNRPE